MPASYYVNKGDVRIPLTEREVKCIQQEATKNKGTSFTKDMILADSRRLKTAVPLARLEVQAV